MRYSLLLCLFLSFTLHAQPRYALVIGNSNYTGKGFLSNPVADAKGMQQRLKQTPLNFKVQTELNLNKTAFESALQDFGERLRLEQQPVVALFYFSGHGFTGKDLNNNDSNYLVPLWNGRLSNQVALENASIPASNIVKIMRRYNPDGINLMVLDACRNSPQEFVENYAEQSKGAQDAGFVSMQGGGVFIAYAAALNSTAYGDTDATYSLYTEQLLEVLSEKSFWQKNITEVFNEAAWRVSKLSFRKQEPWFNGSGIRFCLDNCGKSSPDVSAQLRTCANYFQRDWLTTNPILGADKTALHCYRQVLQADNSNQAALQGLHDIESRYLSWANKAMQRKNWQQAQAHLDKVREINPESSRLVAALDKLGALGAAALGVAFLGAADFQVSHSAAGAANVPPVSPRAAAGGVSADLEVSRSQRSQRSQNITVAGKTYIAYANGTALDTQTNLLWMRCLVGQTWNGNTCTGEAKTFNWEAAKQQTANFAGYSDWRIPTIEELRTLIYCSTGKPEYFRTGADFSSCDGDYQRPTLVQSVFPNAPDWIVWSGSPVSGNAYGAWVVDFNYGFDDYPDSRDHYGHVRLVRERQ